MTMMVVPVPETSAAAPSLDGILEETEAAIDQFSQEDSSGVVLTQNDHTLSPRVPYAKLGLHLIQTKACQSI